MYSEVLAWLTKNRFLTLQRGEQTLGYYHLVKGFIERGNHAKARRPVLK